ncbi:unnamed protein product [Ectocarpus sp. 12 AP-2014]
MPGHLETENLPQGSVSGGTRPRWAGYCWSVPNYEVMASVRTHTALWTDAGSGAGQQAVGIHPAGGVSLSLGVHYTKPTTVRIVLLSTPRENVTWSEVCWISADALNSLSRWRIPFIVVISLFTRKLLYT